MILASASKARLELLESVGITPDKILNTNIDETPKKSEKPLDYVSRIALEKNKSVKKINKIILNIYELEKILKNQQLLGNLFIKKFLLYYSSI